METVSSHEVGNDCGRVETRKEFLKKDALSQLSSTITCNEQTCAFNLDTDID